MYATSNVSQYLPCHAFQSDLAQVFNQTDSHRDDLDLLQTPNQRMTESRLLRQCYYWPKFSHSSDDSIAPLFVICQNLFKFIKKIHIRVAHLVNLLIKTSLTLVVDIDIDSAANGADRSNVGHKVWPGLQFLRTSWWQLQLLVTIGHITVATMMVTVANYDGGDTSDACELQY